MNINDRRKLIEGMTEVDEINHKIRNIFQITVMNFEKFLFIFGDYNNKLRIARENKHRFSFSCIDIALAEEYFAMCGGGNSIVQLIPQHLFKGIFQHVAIKWMTRVRIPKWLPSGRLNARTQSTQNQDIHNFINMLNLCKSACE